MPIKLEPSTPTVDRSTVKELRAVFKRYDKQDVMPDARNAAIVLGCEQVLLARRRRLHNLTGAAIQDDMLTQVSVS